MASLAVYRLARMIPRGEDGPFDVISVLHGWAQMNQKHWYARGLLCFFCISFWLSLGAAALIGAPTWQMFLILWLAINGMAIYWFRRLD